MTCLNIVAYAVVICAIEYDIMIVNSTEIQHCQIVHFLFSMPVVYWPHPLHGRPCAEVTPLRMLDMTTMQVRVVKSRNAYTHTCGSEWSASMLYSYTTLPRMAEERGGYVTVL